MKHFVALISSLLLSSVAWSLPLPSSDELNRLGQQGAHELVAHLLAKAEPDRTDMSAWQQWHRQKMDVLARQGRWQAVIDEYESLAAVLPPAYLHELKLRAVEAYLGLAQAASARDILLPMIWHDRPVGDDMPLLRRLIIKSYLVDGRKDSAQTAIRRYDLDYRPATDDVDWLALKARSLIARGRANEAAIMAVVSEQPELRSVYVLARVSGISPLDEDLWAESLRWLAEPRFDQAYHQQLFDALFSKIQAVAEQGQRLAYLLALSAQGRSDSAQHIALLDSLWAAYESYGRDLANRHQLLIGNFLPWFELAASLAGSQPLKAEALYVWLALHADDESLRYRAHELFVDSLMLQGRVDAVRDLYLSASRFGDTALPEVLAYRLVDLALADMDLLAASKLMSQLKGAEGLNSMNWQLRRARLQILSGVIDYGVELLQQAAAADTLSESDIQYLILATQDLKHKFRYQEAYDILTRMLNKSAGKSMDAQLLYWMADIRRRQQDQIAAARLYLQAAAVAAENSDWQQAARQAAADALAAAGLNHDAALIFRQLQQQASGGQRLFYDLRLRDLKLAK